jgi:hypothetical protein
MASRLVVGLASWPVGWLVGRLADLPRFGRLAGQPSAKPPWPPVSGRQSSRQTPFFGLLAIECQFWRP